MQQFAINIYPISMHRLVLLCFTVVISFKVGLKKMSSYQYNKSHCVDKSVVRPKDHPISITRFVILVRHIYIESGLRSWWIHMTYLLIFFRVNSFHGMIIQLIAPVPGKWSFRIWVKWVTITNVDIKPRSHRTPHLNHVQEVLKIWWTWS